MPILLDKHNPFLKNDIYDKLGISPIASDADIQKAAAKLSPNSKSTDDEKSQKEDLTKSLSSLKRNFTRVGINALILDKIDLNMVDDYLKHLPSLKSEKIKLPKPSLAQLLVEGQNIETSEADFTPLKKDDSFEINMDSVRKILSEKRKVEKQITFET